MIPSPWAAAVLTLGTYRLLRLVGWDDFPLVYKTRAWVIGEFWVRDETDGAITMPGKHADSEVEEVRPAFRRPMLAHLISCPFCIGWWISLTVYLLWLWQPTGTLYAAAPFALSGAVGLIAKNLDA